MFKILECGLKVVDVDLGGSNHYKSLAHCVLTCYSCFNIVLIIIVWRLLALIFIVWIIVCPLLLLYYLLKANTFLVWFVICVFTLARSFTLLWINSFIFKVIHYRLIVNYLLLLYSHSLVFINKTLEVELLKRTTISSKEKICKISQKPNSPPLLGFSIGIRAGLLFVV